MKKTLEVIGRFIAHAIAVLHQAKVKHTEKYKLIHVSDEDVTRECCLAFPGSVLAVVRPGQPGGAFKPVQEPVTHQTGLTDNDDDDDDNSFSLPANASPAAQRVANFLQRTLNIPNHMVSLLFKVHYLLCTLGSCSTLCFVLPRPESGRGQLPLQQQSCSSFKFYRASPSWSCLTLTIGPAQNNWAIQ